ncbi:ABC transporter ATP-binding protein [Pelagibius marinus]|uniref:ABC transporter ATP-binding protein n=1 Tax=Pelagibius marinus TaxID=2762760 RepID=UPI0018727B6A|nr:ABC transporter ATP-binding protein [Pelagibius marinus]
MSDREPVVALRQVIKRYGNFTAVEPMDLNVEPGAFVTLLGPSGCGKTTTLRMVAGLAAPSGGDILIKGSRVNEVPIHKRNLGIVFQNYALFPHKNIFDNVAFGLKYRKVPKAEIAERVARALELVQLPQMADRFPNQLSGGQQQRIALARAIVVEPDVLLLDEPLSALDANLREDMRVELKKIQHQLGITTIFVTHDQSEALAMSDKIVVMNKGRIEQEGSPEEVYARPRSEFVARFLGNSNLLDGTITAHNGSSLSVEVGGLGQVEADANGAAVPQDGQPVRLVVRAEKLHLSTEPSGEPGATRMNGRVDTVDYQGQAARYFVTVGAHSLQVINPIDSRPFAEGAEVCVHVRPRDIVLLTPEA